MDRIRLAGITKESVVDGPGIRYVIWAQGCRHHCPGCHSPFSWDFEAGEERNIDEILTEIKANPLLKGITCSGGDPFEQAGRFAYLAGQVKALRLDVWCYTGYTFEEILEAKAQNKGWADFLENIDVLVDGKFVEEQKDLNLVFRGSTNQRIIDVPASLKAGQIVLWAR